MVSWMSAQSGKAVSSDTRVNRFLIAVIVALVVFIFSSWYSSALDLHQLQESVVDASRKVSGAKAPEVDYHAPSTRPLGDKVIVMAQRKSENTSWVEEYLGDWQRAIYSVDDEDAPLHVNVNVGREANVYLEYIVSHYHHLPEIIAFVHPHHQGMQHGWHTDAPEWDNVYSINKLRLDHVRKQGYANLRCRWAPGCPDEIQPFREHDGMDIENMPDKRYLCESQMRQVWHEIFPTVELPTMIAAPCCAQFVVTRDQVHKRPVEEYQHFHRWLKSSDINEGDLGRIFEYLWHIIFGQEPVFCPEEHVCLVDVYGSGY